MKKLFLLFKPKPKEPVPTAEAIMTTALKEIQRLTEEMRIYNYGEPELRRILALVNQYARRAANHRQIAEAINSILKELDR